MMTPAPPEAESQEAPLDGPTEEATMMAGRVPDRDACVLRNLVDRHAAATPDKPFAVTPEGATITYQDLRPRPLHGRRAPAPRRGAG